METFPPSANASCSLHFESLDDSCPFFNWVSSWSSLNFRDNHLQESVDKSLSGIFWKVGDLVIGDKVSEDSLVHLLHSSHKWAFWSFFFHLIHLSAELTSLSAKISPGVDVEVILGHFQHSLEVCILIDCLVRVVKVNKEFLVSIHAIEVLQDISNIFNDILDGVVVNMDLVKSLSVFAFDSVSINCSFKEASVPSFFLSVVAAKSVLFEVLNVVHESSGALVVVSGISLHFFPGLNFL